LKITDKNRIFKHDTKAGMLGHKLNGFTLLETLIVLLLTSMVVSLTFAYFSAFQKYMRQNISTSAYETNILRFESLINYDLERFDEVSVDNWDNLLLGKEKEITYKFNDHYIIRYQESSQDTLKIEDLEYEYIYMKKHPALLSALKLDFIDLSGRNHNYYFYKEYSVKARFNEFYKDNFQ
jgi:type II secretory pathway pseudopilin PulG